MTPEEALKTIAEESRAHHEMLLAKRAAGDLFYDPPENVLYLHELTSHERFPFDHVARTSTALFATKTLAMDAACRAVRTKCEERSMGSMGKPVLALLDEGKQQEALDLFASRGHTLWFEFDVVRLYIGAR